MRKIDVRNECSTELVNAFKDRGKFKGTLIFYKNILDRFWEKIKNICKITFSLKVLKWQKCIKKEKLNFSDQKGHIFLHNEF